MNLEANIRQVFREGLGFEPTDAMIEAETQRLKHGITYGATSFPTWLGRADPWEVIKAAQQAVGGDAFDQIYRAVLGREPDADGKAFWRGHYEAGRMTLGEVITAIENSNEAQGK